MTPELILIVAATYLGAVGFGDVYACRVLEVRAGALADSTLRLSVLPTDAAYREVLEAHPAPAVVELSLVANAQDEPYGLAPISGFVEASRRSWRIIGLRPVPGGSEGGRDLGAGN